MAAVTSVGIVNGVPTTGTGEVMTLDVIAAKLDTCITALQIIDNMVLAAGTANIGDVDVLTVPTDPFGANADAASASGSVSAKLRAIATALGTTALDLGSGTGGTRTIRTMIDSSQLDPVVAHDAADSGSPYKQGFKATTSLAGLTLVANADRTDGFAGIDGVQIIRPHAGLEDIVTGNATNTDGTSTSCIASSGAGVKTYLTSIVLCNTSATAITVDIKDGSTTKVSLPLPAGSGCVFNPPVPIPGTAATAWSFDPSAAATTVTCSMVGFKSKV